MSGIKTKSEKELLQRIRSAYIYGASSDLKPYPESMLYNNRKIYRAQYVTVIYNDHNMQRSQHVTTAVCNNCGL